MVRREREKAQAWGRLQATGAQQGQGEWREGGGKRGVAPSLGAGRRRAARGGLAVSLSLPHRRGAW